MAHSLASVRSGLTYHITPNAYRERKPVGGGQRMGTFVDGDGTERTTGITADAYREQPKGRPGGGNALPNIVRRDADGKQIQGTNGFAVLGYDLFGSPIRCKGGALAQRFTVPPFSVLNAREGEWQDRKRAWISVGIQSELGRAAVQSSLASARSVQAGCAEEDAESWVTSSIFDPVLCELMYTWFCPAGGQVIDPFAGGSVRGIVAALLGRQYWGCDLRAEQVAANEMQAASVCTSTNGTPRPIWLCGDALEVLADAPRADFCLACPPYGDLECYSTDPRDLSAMTYADFIANYEAIIVLCVDLLAPNRFAVFVVGEFRDPAGNYRGFVPDTINAFKKAGAHLYNEMILVTSVGSLPVRAGKQFVAGRKAGKAHQNVLVFVKGDGKQAARDIERGNAA